MNTTYVSSKVIAEKLIDEYNIVDSDVLLRSSNIIFSELGKLAPNLLTFDNVVYLKRGITRFKIPNWMRSIKYIELIFDPTKEDSLSTILSSDQYKVNGGVVELTIPRRFELNTNSIEASKLPLTEQPCRGELPSSNVFVTNCCPTDIKIVYNHLNIAYDEDTNIWWPLIPEAYRLQDYLVKCVLLGFINRGYQIVHIPRTVLLQELQLAKRSALNDLADVSIADYKLLTEYLHSMHVYSITESFDSIIDKHLTKSHQPFNQLVDNSNNDLLSSLNKY